MYSPRGCYPTKFQAVYSPVCQNSYRVHETAPAEGTVEPLTPEEYTPGIPIPCLPLEEFGIPASLCAKVSIQDLTASIYLRVTGVEDIYLGGISYDNSQLNIDLGVVFSGLGIGTGFGATANILLNTKSGTISACIVIDYGVGSTSPAYGILGTL